jgi:16S rRNA (cytosine967-C5)-methyltransferase
MSDFPVSARGQCLALLDAVLTRRRSLDDALNQLPARRANTRPSVKKAGNQTGNHTGNQSDADRAPADRAPADRDRAMARRIATTVLRRLGQIDGILSPRLKKPLPKRSQTTNILRQAIAELVFLETPPYAAVNGAVELAKQTGEAHYAGLINGVLRKINREGRNIPAPEAAARVNTPDWLWQSWSRSYGEAGAAAISEIHLLEPPVDLTIKDEEKTATQGSGSEWIERLGAVRLPTGGLRLVKPGPIRALPGFDDGAWWVQDAAASLPARMFGDVAGKSVLDLCAAPGGKTAQLAARGAAVTSVDRSAFRLQRLAENLARLGFEANIVAADIMSFRPPSPSEYILLDAPCSATGTIRRHPDVARRKTRADVDAAVAVQSKMLNAAIGMLAPGGLLVYAVCSLEPEEGPQHIAALTSGGAPVSVEPIDAASIGAPGVCVTPEGMLRTLPSHLAELGGMDGFFAARLRRT